MRKLDDLILEDAAMITGNTNTIPVLQDEIMGKKLKRTVPVNNNEAIPTKKYKLIVSISKQEGIYFKTKGQKNRTTITPSNNRKKHLITKMHVPVFLIVKT